MNKKNIKILIIVLSLIILIIFSFTLESTSHVKEGVEGGLEIQTEAKSLSGESIKVSLFVEDKRYEVEAKDRATVFEVMEKLKENKSSNSFTFKYKEYPSLGIFIEGINGVDGGGGEYWIYFINGKEASVGVSNYILKEGDIISWELK